MKSFLKDNKGEVDWFWILCLLPMVIYAIGEILPNITGRPDYEKSQKACTASCAPRNVVEFTLNDKTVKCVCAP